MNGRSKVVPVACPAGGGGEAAVRGFEPVELYELRHRISQRGWRGLCLGLGPKMSLSEKRSERALLSAYTRQPGPAHHRPRRLSALRRWLGLWSPGHVHSVGLETSTFEREQSAQRPFLARCRQRVYFGKKRNKKQGCPFRFAGKKKKNECPGGRPSLQRDACAERRSRGVAGPSGPLARALAASSPAAGTRCASLVRVSQRQR